MVFEDIKKNLKNKIYYEEPNIIIINDDCLNAMKEIPDGSVDLVLTDPPYNIANSLKIDRSNFRNSNLRSQKNITNNFGDWDLFKNDKDFREFTNNWVSQSCRILKDNGHFVSFFNKERISWLYEITNNFGCRYRNVLVWHKLNPTPQIRKVNFCSATEFIYWCTKGVKSGTFNYKAGYSHNIFESGICQGNERTEHPTQKPIKLLNWILKYLSNENDIILDPFLGSGTTAKACKDLGRKCIGIEINEEYVKIAVKRLGQEVLNFETIN